MIVEVCVTSLESALNAERAGAHRIELCSELPLGGVTPSYGLVKTVKEALEIPVHVLIRPRSGDFTYSESEFRAMLEDIEICKSLGVEGIVTGVLDSGFKIDWKRTEALLERSKGCSFTFHRAFDWVADPVQAYLGLQERGVQTLLTSGLAPAADKGLDVLKAILAVSDTCMIMPGGGINPGNAHLFREAGFKALHLSGSRRVNNIPGKPPLPMRASVFPEENEVLITEEELIRQVVESVN